MFPLRFGQMQNCPNQFGEVLICPKHLPKLDQICKKFCLNVTKNLLKFTKLDSNADKILPKYYVNLPNYCQETAQNLFAYKQIYFIGEVE